MSDNPPIDKSYFPRSQPKGTQLEQIQEYDEEHPAFQEIRKALPDRGGTQLEQIQEYDKNSPNLRRIGQDLAKDEFDKDFRNYYILEDIKLKTTINNAVNKNPEEESLIDHIALALGIPKSTVRSDPRAWELYAKVKEIHNQTQTDTVLKDLFSRPEFAKFAHDNVLSLGYFGKVFRSLGRGLQKGMAEDRLGMLNFKIKEGSITTEEQAERTELHNTLADIGKGLTTNPWIEAGATGIGQMIKMFSNVDVLERGLAGASGGAMIGSMIGSAATPLGTAVGAGAGAITGFIAGITSGSWDHTFKMESGGSYVELNNSQDENGNPLDENTKQYISNAVGLINATIETSADVLLTGLFPGIGKVLGGKNTFTFVQSLLSKTGGKEVLSKILNPINKLITGKALKAIPIGMTTEGITEGLQEFVTILGGEAYGLVTGTKIAKDPNAQSNWERILSAAKQGAMTGGGISMIAGTSQLGVSVTKGLTKKGAQTLSDHITKVQIEKRISQTKSTIVSEANATINTIERIPVLLKEMKDNKLFERSPEQMTDFLNKTLAHIRETEGIDLSNMYIDTETFNQSDLLGTLPEELQTSLQQKDNGVSITIPLETFLDKISGQEFESTFIEMIRLTPEGLTAIESRSVIDHIDDPEKSRPIAKSINEKYSKAQIRQQEIKDITKAMDEAQREVVDTLKTRGRPGEVTTTLDKIQTKSVSVLMANAYANLGDQLDLSPMETYKKYPLTFEGHLGPTKEDVRGSVDIETTGTGKRGIVNLFQSSDVSTIIHESMHFFVSVQTDIALQINAKEASKRTQAENTFFEIFNNATIQAGSEGGVVGLPHLSKEKYTEVQEYFATRYEVYLSKGETPSHGLRTIFNSFQKWLLKIYQGTRELELPIHQDVKRFFDHMLATRAVLEEAQDIESFAVQLRESLKEVAIEKEKAQQIKAAKTDPSETTKETTPSVVEEGTVEELTVEEKKLEDIQLQIEKLEKKKLEEIAFTEELNRIMEPFAKSWRLLDQLGHKNIKETLKARKKAVTAKKARLNEIIQEVKKKDLYQALSFIGKGEVLNDDGTITKEKNHKLSTNINAWKLEDSSIGATNWSLFKSKGLTTSFLNGKRIKIQELVTKFGYSDIYSLNKAIEKEYSLRKKDTVKKKTEQEKVTEQEYKENLTTEELEDYRDREAETRAEKKLKKEQRAPAQEVIDFLRDTKLAINVKDYFKDIDWNTLERHNLLTNTYLPGEQITLNEVSDHFNFSSSNEMVKEFKQLGPLKEAIEKEAHTILIQEQGPNIKLDEETISQSQANIALNPLIKQVAIDTYNVLAKKLGKLSISKKGIQKVVEENIQNIIVNELSYKKSLAEGRKAGQLAQRSAKKMDIDSQAKYLQLQIYYTELATGIRDASNQITKDRKYLKKFSVKNRTKEFAKKFDIEFLDQIDNILVKYDLSDRSRKELELIPRIEQFINDLESKGFSPAIPESVLNQIEAISWKDITVEQFKDLKDAIKSLEHVARKRKEAFDWDSTESRTETAENLKASIQNYKIKKKPTEKGGSSRTFFEKAKTGLAKFHNIQTTFHSKLGRLGRAFKERFVHTANTLSDTETRMVEDSCEYLTGIVQNVSQLEGGLNGVKTEITFFEGSKKITLDREGRLAVALYYGSHTGRERLRNGRDWTDDNVMEIIETLTKRELELVNDIHKFSDRHWDEIVQQERRMTGLTPEKVEPATWQVTSSDGQFMEMGGGYTRIFYELDSASSTLDTNEVLKGNFTTIQTKSGYSKKRLVKVDKKVSLHLFSNLSKADYEVVHSLVWREYLIDTDKLLKEPVLKEAIINQLGDEGYKSIIDHLKTIAGGQTGDASGVTRFIKMLRKNVSLATMGFSVTTASMQPFGILSGMKVVGVGHVSRAFGQWVKNRKDQTQWVNGLSPFMEGRSESMNREMMEFKSTTAGKSPLKDRYADIAFYLTRKMQMVADYPTWIGSYNNLISKGETESYAIAESDNAVRSSQGSGEYTYSAEIMNTKKHPVMAIFTMFHSYFSALYSLTDESFYKFKTEKDRFQAYASLISDMMLLYILPSVGSALLMSALKGEEFDDLKAVNKFLAVEQLSYMLGPIIGLRELSGILKGYTYTGSPVTRLLVSSSQFVKHPSLTKAVSLLGDMTGLPSSQLNRIIRSFQHGELNPLNYLLGGSRED